MAVAWPRNQCPSPIAPARALSASAPVALRNIAELEKAVGRQAADLVDLRDRQVTLPTPDRCAGDRAGGVGVCPAGFGSARSGPVPGPGPGFDSGRGSN